MSNLYSLNKDLLIKLIQNIRNDIEIYGLFKCYKESTFDLILCFTSIENAQKYIETVLKVVFTNIPIYPAHCSMTKENNWTYIGDRIDCIHSKGNFGGYVIEKLNVN